MADFVIATVARCSTGGTHYIISGTMNGVAGSITCTAADLALDPGPEALKEAFFGRIRSAIKEAGATTFTAAKTALETKTFKV